MCIIAPKRTTARVKLRATQKSIMITTLKKDVIVPPKRNSVAPIVDIEALVMLIPVSL